MRYLGSKTLLLENIAYLIENYHQSTFCDPFGGIGTVGSYMKTKGYKVLSGDLLNFAHCFHSRCRWRWIWCPLPFQR